MEKKLVEENVRLYSDSILKVAYSYVKNTHDAEDIAQDVFMTLLKKDINFESKEHIKAWLIRVTINKSKNYLKSKWFSKRVEMSEEILTQENEEDGILGAVLGLEDKYRIPIHLFYYEGYSIKEIAEILHKKPATVGSCLSRGREKLRTVLGGGSFE